LFLLGEDVGPEVELEVESGPYRFTYFKRFRRRPETWLRVARPRVEQVAGRQAHDRVQEILRETIDLDLWRAMRIQQGAEIGPVTLSNSRSLMTALDMLAGSEVAGDQEIDLFERSHEEYRRYYTETGRDGSELREAASRIDEARSVVSQLRSRLSALEADVEKAERLDRDIDQLSSQASDARNLADEWELEQTRAEQLEAEVEHRRLEFDAAETRLRAAITSQSARDNLATEIETIEHGLVELTADESQLGLKLKDAAAAAQATSSAEETSRIRREEAEDILAWRRRDYEHRREEVDLDSLVERRDRVVTVRQLMVRAEAFLNQTRLDVVAMKAIERQDLAVETARAALAAGSPTLGMMAQKPLHASIDSISEVLQPGIQMERSIPDRIEVSIPGTIDFFVRAGTSVESLNRSVATASEALRGLLREYGVTSREEASELLKERHEAQTAVVDGERRLSETLKGLSFEELDKRIAAIEESNRIYTAQREKNPIPVGGDVAECRLLRDGAEQEATKAISEHQAAHDGAKATGDILQDLRIRHQDAVARLEMQSGHCAERKARLAEARLLISDDALTSAVVVAEAEELSMRAKLCEAADLLTHTGPETVRTLAENARAASTRLTTQCRELEQEQVRVLARLELMGEEGLGEATDAAATQFARLEHEESRLKSRARAARHLYEVLRLCRDAAKRKHEGPLRDRINELGRTVFGSSFEVELDEGLRISSRILDGEVLEFDQLSTGTQEQLGLLSRLACALIVGDAEGVPLLVDDALGYSDDERLERMGAIFTLAGRYTQVLVLTCQPGRYRWVGHAKTIRLS